MYGSKSIRPQSLVLGAVLATNLYGELLPSEGFNVFIGRDSSRPLTNMNQWNFHALLLQIKASRSRDIRDNVYAFLGILKYLGFDTSTVPDNSRPIQEVYAWATRQWIGASASLECLALACTTRVEPDLPSWVVDWTSAVEEDWNVRYEIYFCIFDPKTQLHATKQCPFSGIDLDSHRLVSLPIRGLTVDHIMSVHAPMAESDQPVQNTLNRIRFVHQHCQDRTHLQEWISELTELTFTHNTGIVEDSLLHRAQADLRSLFQHLSGSLEMAGHPDSMEKMLVSSHRVRETSTHDWELAEESNRRDSLFITKEGRLGLFRHYGTRRLLKNDRVVLVTGSDFPMILRQKEEQTQLGEAVEYEFVGFAIVSGVMKGELWPDRYDEAELDEFRLV